MTQRSFLGILQSFIGPSQPPQEESIEATRTPPRRGTFDPRSPSFDRSPVAETSSSSSSSSSSSAPSIKKSASKTNPGSVAGKSTKNNWNHINNNNEKGRENTTTATSTTSAASSTSSTSPASTAAASLSPVAFDPRSPCEIDSRTPFRSPTGLSVATSASTRLSSSSSSFFTALSTTAATTTSVGATSSTATLSVGHLRDESTSSIECDSPVKIVGSSIFAGSFSEHLMFDSDGDDDHHHHHHRYGKGDEDRRRPFHPHEQPQRPERVGAAEEGGDEHNTSIVDATILDSSLVMKESAGAATRSKDDEPVISYVSAPSSSSSSSAPSPTSKDAVAAVEDVSVDMIGEEDQHYHPPQPQQQQHHHQFDDDDGEVLLPKPFVATDSHPKTPYIDTHNWRYNPDDQNSNDGLVTPSSSGDLVRSRSQSQLLEYSCPPSGGNGMTGISGGGSGGGGGGSSVGMTPLVADLGILFFSPLEENRPPGSVPGTPLSPLGRRSSRIPTSSSALTLSSLSSPTLSLSPSTSSSSLSLFSPTSSVPTQRNLRRHSWDDESGFLRRVVGGDETSGGPREILAPVFGREDNNSEGTHLERVEPGVCSGDDNGGSQSGGAGTNSSESVSAKLRKRRSLSVRGSKDASTMTLGMGGSGASMVGKPPKSGKKTPGSKEGVSKIYKAAESPSKSYPGYLSRRRSQSESAHKQSSS